MAQEQLNRPPNPNDPMFTPWIYQLWKRVAQAGQIAWNQITGVPANLSAIANLAGDGYAKKTGSTWSLDAGGGGSGNAIYNTIATSSTVDSDVTVPYLDNLYVKNDLTVNGNLELWKREDVLLAPQDGNSGKFLTTDGTTTSWAAISGGSGGTVTSVSVASANGFAGSVANPSTTPAITLSTSITGVLKGNGTAISAAVAGTDYVAPGGALGTPLSGNLANCTFPTLNQSTTGNAATATALQTARTINGTSFDGTANITVTAAAGTLTGTTLASGVTSSSLTSLGIGAISSGTYTPTLTNVTNITSSTAYTCQYIRLGSIVLVSGHVAITPTSSNTLSELGVSLPVASNFSSQENCGGSAVCENSSDGTTKQSGAVSVYADATNDRASFRFSSIGASNSHGYSFSFMYRII